MKKVIDFLLSTWNKGFFHVLVANVLIALAAFGSQLFVAKVLTDVQLGYIKIFQSYTQILSIVAGMGFSTSTLIFCSGTQDMNQKLKHFSIALYAVVPISFISLFLFVGINQFGILTRISEVKVLFDKYSFIVVFTAIIAVYTAFIQSSKIFKKYSNLVIVTKLISIGFIVLLTYLRGFYGFFEGLWIGLFFSFIINVFFIKKEFNFYIQRNIPQLYTHIKEHFKIGIHGLGTNVFGMIASNIDIIMLGFFLKDELATVGQYSFAAIFITGLSMIQGTIVQVTVPYLAKYKNDYVSTTYLLRKYNRALLLGTIMLLFVLYLLLPVLIKLVYESKYNEGVFYLMFLLGVWFFKCLNAINAAFFLSSGRSDLSNLINLLSMIFTSIVVTVSLILFSIEVMIIGKIMVSFCITLYSHFLVKKEILKISSSSN